MNTDLSEPLLTAEEDPVVSSTTEEHESNNNSNVTEEYEDTVVDNQQGGEQNNEIMPRSKAFFLAAVSVATIPMFLFGFNTGVLNAPEAVIFPNHTTLEWSSAVSGFCVGGFIGANFSGSLADQWGRSVGLVTIFWINLAAGILHMMTPNMGGLILARVLVGVAGGASTVITPTYLSEISPKDIRGSIGTLTQLSCVVGILASILWELPFDSETRWRFIFLPLPIMALLGILLAPFVLVESPSWLLLRYSVERRQEAFENLRKLRGLRGHDDDGVIEMIMHEEITASTRDSSRQNTSITTVAVAEEGDDDDDDENSPGQDDSVGTSESHRVFTAYRSFRSYFLDPKNRIPLISSILFPVAQQLSGINAGAC
eukprot:scaffold132_cov170-Amphora_coffeaeformis.AAC.41